MKKIVYILWLVTISITTLSFAANDMPSEKQHNPPASEVIGHQLIVLMNSDEYTPRKINRDLKSNNQNILNIFGDITNAKYLIQNRKTIGISGETTGLMPEELEKLKYVRPDLTLVHPDSVEARLQRYMVLDYANKEGLERGKERLTSNPNVYSVEENQEGDFLATPNDTFFQNLNEYQWGMFDLNLPNAWDKTKGHAYQCNG